MKWLTNAAFHTGLPIGFLSKYLQTTQMVIKISSYNSQNSFLCCEITRVLSCVTMAKTKSIPHLAWMKNKHYYIKYIK